MSGEKNWGVVFNRSGAATSGDTEVLYDAEKAITGFLTIARIGVDVLAAGSIETFANNVEIYCKRMECTASSLKLFGKALVDECAAT